MTMPALWSSVVWFWSLPTVKSEPLVTKDGKRKEEEGKHTDGVKRDELGDSTLSLFSHMLIYTVITAAKMFVSYKCIHQVSTS